MRVNTGHVIPFAVACLLIFAAIKEWAVSFPSFLWLELLALVLLFAIYGFNIATIVTVPAAFFRDGFHLNVFSLETISACLFGLFALANILWSYAAVKEGRRLYVGIAHRR
jgi:hypothetical protein